MSRTSFCSIETETCSRQTRYSDYRYRKSACVSIDSLLNGKLTLRSYFTFQVKENIPEEIKSFREDVWPEPLFMDEKLEFYTAVGGGKKNQYSSAGFLATLANPFSKLYKNVITKGKKYKQKTNLVGEGLITGGLYVVHAGGKPEYSFLEKVIGDHVNMTEVMEACEKVAKEAEKASTDAKSKSGL